MISIIVPKNNNIGVKKIKLLIPNKIGIVNNEDAQAFLEFVSNIQKIMNTKLVLNNMLLFDFFKAKAIEIGNKKVNQDPA